MKKRMTKKGFRLVSVLYFLALVALSFSVYTFLHSATFAWFAKNNDVSVNGLSISTVDDHRGHVTLTAYKYDLDSLQGVECQKDQQGNYLLEMNQYDTIFSQLNVYNGLLLKFNIVLGDFSSFKIALVHDANLDGNTNTKLSKYLSSVCVVKAAIFEGNNALDETSADTLWHDARDAFAAIQSSKVYVSKEDDVFSKSPSVSFAFNHASSTEGFDVYFWIDYSPTLVEEYLNAGGEADESGGALSGTGTYTMANDIIKAQASFAEAN